MATVVVPPRFRRAPRPTDDDEDLVARIRAGDESAFELLYSRYHEGLLGFCRHLLGDRDEAEDALQHVLVAAHRRLLHDERPIHLRPWLYRVARNRCLSMLRSRTRTTPVEDPVALCTAGLTVADQVERRQELRDVLADLGRLPEDQRAALVLAELDALPHAEIAEVLDVRQDKVKALIFQARSTLVTIRTGRTADCDAIREQLETLRGSSLRRAYLRHHVRSCGACARFESELSRKRAALALVLPVVPTVGLRDAILGPLGAGSGAAGATGAVAVGAGGVGVPAGAGALAAATAVGAPAGASTLAAKVLVVGAILGGSGAGGAAVVDDVRADRPQAAASSAASDRGPTTAAAAVPAGVLASGAAEPAAGRTIDGRTHPSARSGVAKRSQGVPARGHEAATRIAAGARGLRPAQAARKRGAAAPDGVARGRPASTERAGGPAKGRSDAATARSDPDAGDLLVESTDAAASAGGAAVGDGRSARRKRDFSARPSNDDADGAF